MDITNVRYIVDGDGKRVAVILDIAEYERLLQQAGAAEPNSAGSPVEPAGVPEQLRDLVRQGVVTFHPRAPDASRERLRDLAGIISLRGPVPSGKFLEEDSDEDSHEHVVDDAGD